MFRLTKIPFGFAFSNYISYCDYDKNTYDKHIHETLTKKEFYKKFPNYKPLKIIRSDMTHHNYVYSMGLNTINEFKPFNTCSNGGFYLADCTDIFKYSSYGENVAMISLHDDVMIYVEANKNKRI